MYTRWSFFWIILAALVLAGCGATSSPADTASDEPAAEAEEQAQSSSDREADETAAEADDQHNEDETTTEPEEPEAAARTNDQTDEFANQPPPAGAESQFTTDFSRASISFDEILSGGPPKDGIPSIDEPQFVSVEEADEWIGDTEPIVRVQVDDAVKAYPIQILTWHELVNDTVGDLPLVVSFCPLCNTAIVFERTVDDEVLDFGTTGRLRMSNLIMYDRQTETWWQQATGEGIVGEQTGAQLEFYPAEMIAWADFKANHPDGEVLSRDTGFNRNYGNNPYVGYDDINSSPFLYDGPPTPGELRPVERVLTIETASEAVAYPYTTLEEVQVVNDTVDNTEVVVFWEAGTSSALDTGTIADGRDVGSANAYNRELDGQTLTFALEDGAIVDEETGSTWSARGTAIDGELEGAQLEPVVAINHFWFSWAAFKPETRIYQG